MFSTTSSRKARMFRSGSFAAYVAGSRLTTSSVSSRLSSSHFFRPPSSSLTSPWPYSLNYQYA